MSGLLLGDVEAHFWLTRSVARMIGVNLSDAMAEGYLTPGEYAGLVTACRSGPCGGRCAAWLAEQPGRADAPPPFCVNAAALGALKAVCGRSATGASDRSAAPARDRS